MRISSAETYTFTFTEEELLTITYALNEYIELLSDDEEQAQERKDAIALERKFWKRMRTDDEGQS